MKICIQCKKSLPFSEFTNDKTRKDGLCPYCKTCKNINEKQRKINRTLLTKEIKSNYKCISCGESDPVCLDFHHLDPDKKDYSIATMFSNYMTLDDIYKEISKCICLCSNCHRKFHAYNWVYLDGNIITGD